MEICLDWHHSTRPLRSTLWGSGLSAWEYLLVVIVITPLLLVSAQSGDVIWKSKEKYLLYYPKVSCEQSKSCSKWWLWYLFLNYNFFWMDSTFRLNYFLKGWLLVFPDYRSVLSLGAHSKRTTFSVAFTESSSVLDEDEQAWSISVRCSAAMKDLHNIGQSICGQANPQAESS